jgi:hypothetical protein
MSFVAVVAAPSHVWGDHSNSGTFEGSVLAKKQQKITKFFGDERWDEPPSEHGDLSLFYPERRRRNSARAEKQGKRMYLFQNYNRL